MVWSKAKSGGGSQVFRWPAQFWYAVAAANVVIILGYWWQGSGSLLTDSMSGASIALGRLAGLAAGAAVRWQFVSMGRAPWLERTFGLDKLARLHHTSGKLVALFLLAHPTLLIFGYSRLGGVSWGAQLKSFLLDYDKVLWAGVGWLLFMAVIASSLVIVRGRLKYEAWYFVHLLVYLAVLASFWHQFAVGTTLLTHRLFYGYWVGLYVVVLGSHMIFRWGRPVYLFYRHGFRVSRVERENHNAVSIYISGRHMEKFKAHPGQFMIVRFLIPGRWWQAHPFSLSMLPDGRQVRITVKELGDFTRGVKNIPVGTKVIIDGPYGIFTDWMSKRQKVLLIAGGIGITPIRSLFEHMLKAGKDVVLLYANKTEQDIVFRKDLENLAGELGGRVVHVLSDEPEWRKESGYVDEEKIRRLVPDVTARDVYVCGPPPMIKAVIAALRTVGVPAENIHWEKFSF